MKQAREIRLLGAPDLKIIVLIFFATVVLFTNLSSWGVTETSEARYAEISWEMYQSGDYLHPRLLNIGHYHKPPVTYWITAIAYHIFGPTAFAARFFLQIAVLIQILLVYQLGKLFFSDPKTPFYSACIYFSFVAVIMSSRALTTDAYLNTAILGAIFSWVKYRKIKKMTSLYLFYFLLGVGFLVKGPVVLIIPLIVVIGYNKIMPGRAAKKIHHMLGALIFLIVGFSWFVMLYIENSDFLEYFVIDHTVNRFLENDFGRNKPFWFYILLVPITSFPWFLMLYKPLILIRKREFNIQSLLVIWIFLPLIFFSLSSSKLILYVLPVYPAIALGAAYLWNQKKFNHQIWLKTFLIFSFLVATVLLFAPLIDKSIAYNYTIYGIIIGLIIALIAYLIFFMKRHNEVSGLIYLSVFLTSSLTVLATFVFHANPSKVHDQRNVASFIKTKPEIAMIYVYDERLPSLAFHLDQEIISIADGDKSLMRELQFEKGNGWQNTLVTPAYISKNMLKKAAFVVEEGDEVSEIMKNILSNFKKKEVVDSWIVYYGY